MSAHARRDTNLVVGVVGLGVGEQHALAYARHPAVCRVVLCDHDAGRSAAVASRVRKSAVAASFESMIRDLRGALNGPAASLGVAPPLVRSTDFGPNGSPEKSEAIGSGEKPVTTPLPAPDAQIPAEAHPLPVTASAQAESPPRPAQEPAKLPKLAPWLPPLPAALAAPQSVADITSPVPVGSGVSPVPALPAYVR